MKNKNLNNGFCEIKQKNIIHSLISLDQNKMKSKQDNYGYSLSGYEIVLKLGQEKRFKTSTLQFLLFCMAKATYENLSAENTTLYISLEEYMKFRNLTNRVNARNKIREDISALISFNISFYDKQPKDYKDKQPTEFKIVAQTFNVLSSITRFYKGNIRINFTKEFLEFYNVCPKLKVPYELFAINTKDNPNSLNLLWKMSVNNKIGKYKNTLNIETLLNFCPAIPKNYDDIVKVGQLYQRVIKPFERDMDALNIIDWYYLDISNNRIPKGHKSVGVFMGLKVIFTFKNVENENAFALNNSDL